MRSLLTGSLASAALAAGILALPGAAQASPQILGIVASNGTPTPLVCDGTECGAHFSAFCLQEARPAPSSGDRYTIAPGSSMTLIASAPDGTSVRLPAEGFVQITSQIGFTSVHIAVPQSVVSDLGASLLAIEVGPHVSVLPVAAAGDVQPQTADEIAYATGIMRDAAVRKFDASNAASDAARIASLFINALPAKGQESKEERHGLWAANAGSPALTGATPEGLAMAEDMYHSCQISVEARSSYSMRMCLELRHADLQASTNHQFWKDTAAY
jgi:hypothetical protein